MKYHKIRNVEKSVCTAEQMIAYNAAFVNHYNFHKKMTATESGVQVSELTFAFVKTCMQNLKNSVSWENISKKYDVDAIECAIRAGAEKYISSPKAVMWSHKEVGEMFPAYYL